RARRVFADGHCLARHTKTLTGRSAEFLASSRRLPPAATLPAWNGELRHVLFVGRYHENKGPDLLLDAIAELPDGLLDGIRVHMFGHGPLERRLLDTLASSARLRKTVSIHGTLSGEGFAAALRASDALVVPSRIESVPVVLSDAAQCGTPVVCTDVGDMGALVRGHRAGAVAVEASPRFLAAAIRETLETPRSTYAPGLAGLWKHLGLERSVERFLEFAAGEA
ncbi:MAG: glycosyltransferase, partial [Planctomycetota bacterium]